LGSVKNGDMLFIQYKPAKCTFPKLAHSSTCQTAYTDACKNITIPYCIYNRLPEDEPSGSKHVEDIKKLRN